MYQPICPCLRRAGLAGLGSDILPALATAVGTAYGGPAGGAAAGAIVGGSGDSGGGAGMPGMTSTVSPQISTQISPQISPVFQQQFQPQNSAATAGTSQVLPGMPAMTAPAGNGMVPTGVGVPGYAQPVIPLPSTGPDYTKYMPYALAGMGILAFVTLRKRGTKKAA